MFLCLYGWWYWLHGNSRDEQPPVTRLPAVHLISWISLGLLGTFALGYTMHRYTDASLPYWDAATTVLSLIAQYLLARKRLESWLFWISVNVMAIGVYLAKDLYLTTGLYTLFLGLAVAGFIAWQRSLTPTTPVPAPA